MAVSIAQMVGVNTKRNAQGLFKALQKPAKMGNNAPLAFGGCILSQCISSAFASLPSSPDYECFSVLGNFLGPGSIEVYTKYEVEDIRTTKTFATRKVVAWQDLEELPAESKTKRPPAGKGLRRVMIMMVDFQVREKSSMFDYSPLPVHATPSTPSSTSTFTESVKAFYSHHTALPRHDEHLRSDFAPEVAEAYESMFPLFGRFFDSRCVVNSMAVQLALGMDAKRESTQDHEPIQRRCNSLWWKGIADMDFSEKGVNEAALAFLMDGALAFLPLTFTHRTFFDVSAVSSLEFSLRFLSPPDMSKWHLSEQTTEAGMHGRTFSTGRMWDESGRLTAVMTQMSIMRGWPEGTSRPKL